MSELVITPDFGKKKARIKGVISAGEKVSVTIVGAASLISDSLRFRVSFAGRLLAKFPLPADPESQEDREFHAEDGDLKFTLNLCTLEMQKIFRRIPEMDLIFVLEDPGPARTLYFAEYHTVKCWNMMPGTDIPVDLSKYPSELEKIRGSVSDLQTEMDGKFTLVNRSLSSKVNKEPGKGLSHVDVTLDTLAGYATRSDLQRHAADTDIHTNPRERAEWNAKVSETELDKKGDVIVQDGYIYIPDRNSGHWRRTQARYDVEMMGVVLDVGEDIYIRNSRGFEKLM